MLIVGGFILLGCKGYKVFVFRLSDFQRVATVPTIGSYVLSMTKMNDDLIIMGQYKSVQLLKLSTL
jgi:hypothetical protein